MARLSAPFNLSGTLGQLVAYQRKDMPGTLVRTATSITSGRFHTDPHFANSRRTATESGGRSRAAQALRRVLHPLSPVRDHNWQGALTGALTPLQHRDTESLYGQRNVLLSKYGSLLEGFCLSKVVSFETLLRTPLLSRVDKPSGTATVEVPELMAGVNLWLRTPEPYFRVVAALGVVPDLFYSPGGYEPRNVYQPSPLTAAYSAWHPVKGGAPAFPLELKLPVVPPGEDYALVLAAGVVLGTPDKLGDITPVTYRGSGRIIMIV